MAKAYARQTKLTNVVGRSDYISNEKRQEKIVLHSRENMKYTWQEYATFEKENQKSNIENNQAREIVIALPNALDQDHKKIKKIVEVYSKSILGENRDFEYAVHWNETHTNLHAHIIFSERERQEKIPKTYKRDYYYNFEDGKMSNKKDPKAEITKRKGDFKYDENGEVEYTEQFSKKDPHFKSKQFNQKIKENLSMVLKENNFKVECFDDEVELAQIKIGKTSHEDFKKMAIELNKAKQDYNREIKRALETKALSRAEAKAHKKETTREIKRSNNPSKKITQKAINFIKDKVAYFKHIIKEKIQKIGVGDKVKKLKEHAERINADKLQKAYRCEIRAHEFSIQSQELQDSIDNNNSIINNLTEDLKEVNDKIGGYKQIRSEITTLENNLKNVQSQYGTLRFYEILKTEELNKQTNKIKNTISEIKLSIKDNPINEWRVAKASLVEKIERINSRIETQTNYKGELEFEKKKQTNLYHKIVQEMDEVENDLKLEIFDLNNPEIVRERETKAREKELKKKISKIIAEKITNRLNSATPKPISDELTQAIEEDVFNLSCSNKDFDFKEFLMEFNKQTDPNTVVFKYKSSTYGFENSNFEFEQEVKRQRYLQRSVSMRM